MYHLYCDGSALPHSRCAGWAYVIEGLHSNSGCSWKYGINVMELVAVIEGLKCLPPGSTVMIHTDSHYVISNAFKYEREPMLIMSEFRNLLKLYDCILRRVTKSVGLHRRAHYLAREAIDREIRLRGTYQGVISQVSSTL